MWPFKSQNQSTRTPTISIDGIVATWTEDYGWSFVDPVLEVDCHTFDNDIFVDEIVNRLPLVREWIKNLFPEIDLAVKKFATDQNVPSGQHEMIGIDFCNFAELKQISISFSADDWGDFGVDVIIRDGVISNVVGGD